MATLQKFKHMAAQCAVMGGGSPSRNPTTSPIILRRRRRKTLLMFLGRAPTDHRRGSPERPPALPLSDGAVDSGNSDSRVGGVGARVRHKLKDLFISTSLEDETGEEDGVEGRRVEPRARLLGSGGNRGGGGVGMRRLRCRLMRTSWRPVLVAIPE